jgi:hypothetical protein
MNQAVIGSTFSGVRKQGRWIQGAPMSDQSTSPAPTGARRTQVTRRRPRREAFTDTTLTDTWPPRLNTAL